MVNVMRHASNVIWYPSGVSPLTDFSVDTKLWLLYITDTAELQFAKGFTNGNDLER